ncbi:NAD-dependent epimerase/dehydratase family protein [Segatella paludivivens]|uniref:NAD-dependent epimerase/dehydratase family protein n=1 Tax=Segatella paludivivens TaxID=185294 RepID=UPI00036F701A|nr:NAD-dependent epimerase/dehydratase family protein [Segatella paludivivens]
MKILVTGAAGFIGSKISYLLAERGDDIVAIDNINDYYDVRLKYGRLRELGIGEGYICLEWNKEYNSTKFKNLKFLRIGIDNHDALSNLFAKEHFDKVINLAAQAGVRYSIANPYAYMTSNLDGFLNIIECCRNYPIKHFLFASSSSVYGMNKKVPFSEEDVVQTPVSLYAASKKSNELMAHCYSKLYGIPCTGVRYFTVYGPWGRPDMAPMVFAKAITNENSISVFNNGDMIRDFTYIDDIANGSIKILDNIPINNDCANGVPYRIYNIGCSNPVKLMDFINEIEIAVGKKAKKIFKPMQPGDVYMTYADTTKLQTEIGYKPNIDLHEGINKFIEWYKSDKNPLK